MPREDGSETPAPPEPTTLSGVESVSPLALRPTVLRGVRVGPFEIKGLLGSGGFGDVFLAEQHEPVHRLAAVKMLSPHRQDQRFRALFDAERRVLAQIDHPNVARVLDAGTTAEGSDWVAMEFAPGQPINAYCDQNRMSIAERVHLFATVVRAVDFAHEKGVVHRDLKPGNILVSVDGGRPVPKIIDFGIARVLGAEAQAIEPTRVIGTPGYMAPEQTIGGGADADPRTDVYSLGAILFELCCGTLPHEDAAGPADASPEARMLRTREHDAPLMSQRVRRTPADAAQRIAANRRATPHELEHTLRGDLDWVVACCLDRDRMRRYANAGELCEDLRRWHLKRPLAAAPQTMRYRARKFVARNRATVTLAALLAAAVVSGLVASISGWHAATRERDIAAAAEDLAAREATEARSAASYISAVLGAANVDHAPDGAALTVVDLLHQAARAADTELRDRPATEAVVRLALGRTYATLGLLDEAQTQLLRANALTDAAYGRQSNEMAETLEALAEVSLLRGNLAAARALLGEARQTYTRQPGDNSVELSRNSRRIAEVDIDASDPDAALRNLADAERLARGAGDAGNALLGSIDWYRSLAYLEQGAYAEALQAIERNLAINRSALPADHWWVAESETVRAAALAGLGRTPEAIAAMQRAMPQLEHALRPGAPTLRKAFARAAFVAERAGDAPLAQRYHALAKRPPDVHPPLPPGTPGRALLTQGRQ